MKGAARLRVPAQIALAAFVAYGIGLHFTSLFPGYLPKIGGIWSAISAIVVTQNSKEETATSASLRVLGSAIGAFTSALYLTLMPFHPLGMALVIFTTVMICTTFQIHSHARLAAITVIVVMVTASLDTSLNPGLNALLRFAESCIGTGVALLEVQLWPGPSTRSSDNAPRKRP